MSKENDIFSNKLYLKKINKNFLNLIELIQLNYKPLVLSSVDKSIKIEEITLQFLQEFNGSNQNEQIQLLSNISNLQKLWKFLSLNPTLYDCQTFLEELYQLTILSLLVKQHLVFHFEEFLLTLGISYDDNLRFNCFKILALLMNNSHPEDKETIGYLNRICYECLYDFDIYYKEIESFTIESRIIELNKEDIQNLIHENFIEKDLEKKINDAIKELGGEIFFKMYRSPKDAYENLSKQINNEWSYLWKLKSNEDPRLYFMKIENIDQLKLLLKSSDRLHQDLIDLSLNKKFILRKWINYLPNEYRCFICNGKLNALSTYGYQQFSQENEKKLKKFINSKTFQDIILTIPYSHAVVDCSIDLNDYLVIIIEINPFSKRSSAAKFSWIIDRDILFYYYQNNGSVFIKL